MSRHSLIAGSAVPPGYDVAAAIKFARGVDTLTLPDDPISKDLGADLSATGEWGVRNQYMRGTCNAFAVVAAEEIWSHCKRIDNPWTPLSEEFLYHCSRGVSLEEAGIELSEKEKKKMDASGATFLKQVAIALKKHGLCREELMVYDPSYPLPHTPKHPSPPAIKDAASRLHRFGYDEHPFTHNIVKFAAVGKHKEWKEEPGARISQVFIDQLSTGTPIVAAFALLTGQGRAAWLGQKAQEFGHVDYAPDEIARELIHDGGHSVCILGFITNYDEPEDSMFVFRNGYGTRFFSRHPMSRMPYPQAPRPGYGLISARHVERYCWEYLYRT